MMSGRGKVEVLTVGMGAGNEVAVESGDGSHGSSVERITSRGKQAYNALELVVTEPLSTRTSGNCNSAACQQDPSAVCECVRESVRVRPEFLRCIAC
jgi:hypothetical protein